MMFKLVNHIHQVFSFATTTSKPNGETAMVNPSTKLRESHAKPASFIPYDVRMLSSGLVFETIPA